MLAIEYALKYQQHLKGLVISNMMASIPAYNEYAHDVLMPAMDQKVLAEIKRLEAAGRHREPALHGAAHASTTTCSTSCACPATQWPDPVNRAFAHINPTIYVPMQGPSELGASGKLANWDRTADLGQHHRADAGHRRHVRHDGSGAHGDGWPSASRTGATCYCPNGSHMAMYDDQETYFAGLIDFIIDIDQWSAATHER